MKKLESFDQLVKLPEQEQKTYINNWHNKENLSIAEIAERLNTYANKIRRLAKKLEITTRNKSDAQKVALKTGRHEHPTKGKIREEDVKIRISEKMALSWENMPDAEKERRVNLAKAQWENMSQEEKDAFHNKANIAVRESAKTGSKLERLIMEHLINLGYRVVCHKEHSLASEKLHLDLFLPEINLVIEIDGPSHFLPIWGEDTLQKTQATDAKKDGLVLGAGYCMVRIRVEKTLSQKRRRDILSKLTGLVKSISEDYPKPGSRFFILGEK